MKTNLNTLNNIEIPESFKAKYPYLVKENDELTLLGYFLLTSCQPDDIDLIQQWFGYHLCHEEVGNLNKMVILTGDGQGQMLKLLASLVGDGETVWIINEISKKVVPMLKGKKALLSTRSEKIDIRVLKQIISGESIYAEAKYKEPEIITPDTIVTLAHTTERMTNPKFASTQRRLLWVKLNKLDAFIPDIAMQIIKDEFDQLHAFALAGATRLIENGKFQLGDDHAK